MRRFSELRKDDVDYAGGKGANLGELTAAGVPVPPGFVVGAPAYAAFCEETGLRARLAELLEGIDVEDNAALSDAAARARALFDETAMPEWLERVIRDAYGELADAGGQTPVAVRSSATAEDTAEASFAGMNETFLNTTGGDAVIDAVRHCWRSLFGARTVYYRGQRGLGQASMDIAVVVQRQIQSTRSGVMFTVNPATGDLGQLVIEGSFGLGEAVVSGPVSPDRYVVDKPTLAIRAREVHHKELVIESVAGGGTQTRLLAEESHRAVLSDDEVRPVAAHGSRSSTTTAPRRTPSGRLTPTADLDAAEPPGHDPPSQRRPTAAAEPAGAVLLRGLGGAPGSASGVARVLSSLHDAAKLADGEVLVTHMTAPDWVPLMRRAAAIVTDSGGMTCHAAIVSRELGIPCVVGTGEATRKLRDGELVTVDATEGTVIERRPRAGAPARRRPARRPVHRRGSVTGTRSCS